MPEDSQEIFFQANLMKQRKKPESLLLLTSTSLHHMSHVILRLTWLWIWALFLLSRTTYLVVTPSDCHLVTPENTTILLYFFFLFQTRPFLHYLTSEIRIRWTRVIYPFHTTDLPSKTHSCLIWAMVML